MLSPECPGGSMQCETEKATIHYEQHGEGRPILFLHGWTMDRRVEMADYERIFATRPGWRRLYPDLPGMGRSVAKGGLANQDDVLEALLAFIDHVLPAGRFVLAGTSGGGYLARAVAARRRSRIAGLLLRVPCIFAEDARRTVPSFRALVRTTASMASLDEEDRANARRPPDPDARLRRSVEAKRDAAGPAGHRGHGADRQRDPRRSQALRASPSIWPRWRRPSTSPR